MDYGMELLDELYVQECGEPELLSLLRELRKRVLGTKFPGDIVPRTDPEFLAKHLRVSGNNVDKALKTVKQYYSCIQKHKDLVDGLRPSVIHPAAATSNIYYPLKHRFNGQGVVLGIIRNWDPRKIPLIAFEQIVVLAAEVYANDIELQKNGIVAISDVSGVRFEHARRVTFRDIRRGLDLAPWKGMPGYPTEVHFINVPKIFWPMYAVVRPFLRKKILNRLHFHSNVESLHKHFDKRYLPECVNGELSDQDACDWEGQEAALAADIPFEEYWNGALWKPNPKQAEELSRRKATIHGFNASTIF